MISRFADKVINEHQFQISSTDSCHISFCKEKESTFNNLEQGKNSVWPHTCLRSQIFCRNLLTRWQETSWTFIIDIRLSVITLALPLFFVPLQYHITQYLRWLFECNSGPEAKIELKRNRRVASHLVNSERLTLAYCSVFIGYATLRYCSRSTGQLSDMGTLWLLWRRFLVIIALKYPAGKS